MTQDNKIHTGCKSPAIAMEDLVDYAVEVSHVRKSDHIMIVGRKSLGLLFGVCRRGFLHADCRVAKGPHAGEGPADSLWILNTEDAAELRTLIADCGRDLRANGTLIIGPNPDLSEDGAARLKDILAQCGYVPENESHPADHVFLLCLRKQAAALALAA